MKSRLMQGTGVACVAGGLLMGGAALATAHQPEVVDDCKGITVHLEKYNDKPEKKNTVEVSINGALKYGNYDFGSSYDGYFPFPDPTKENSFMVTVKAWDDPNGLNGWTFTRAGEVPACYPEPTETPSPTTTPSPSQTPSESATPSPSASTSTTPPPPTTAPPTPSQTPTPTASTGTPTPTPTAPSTPSTGTPTPTPPSTIGTPTTSPSPERPRLVQTDTPEGMLAATGSDNTALFLYGAAALLGTGFMLIRLAYGKKIFRRKH